MANTEIEDPEQLLEKTVKEVKSEVRETDNPDYKQLKELEEQGKNRKTLKKFFNSRIEDQEESEEQEENLEDSEESGDSETDETEEEEETESEQKDSNSISSSGGVGKEKKLNQALEDMEEVQGIKGAAVVRRDGLLIASNMRGNINDDQVGAMTASTVGSGETASEALSMGGVNEVTVEAKNGKLVATGAGDKGILAVLAKSDVNMGLVKVELENAVEKIKRVL